VTSPEVVLETQVAKSRAVVSAPPEFWSYSTLKEVGECPRRFALTHARYPDLWDRPMYPTLPNPAALFGNVVHAALEVVVRAFVDAGVTSVNGVEGTDVLRELCGLTSIVEDATTKELAPLDDNPRLTNDQRRRLARNLRARAPEARMQVQTYLSRTPFTPSANAHAVNPSPGASAPRRRALQEGSHAEVRLVAPDLSLTGRIDLLTIAGPSVTIVDYKSGAPSAAHQEQLWLYALLWVSDDVANPDGRAVDALVAAYRERDAAVETPSAAELDDMAKAYGTRVGDANSELRSSDPPAKPSEEGCRFCSVRQLCNTYWERMVPEVASVNEGAWFDFEGVVGARNGPHSWWMARPGSRQPELLLRTSSQAVPLVEGDRIRMLGLHRASDPELTKPVATFTSTSEVFRLEH
jgi:hypothetical protein